MSEGSYRVGSTFFVTISFLLQIASIVSPGWVIDIQQNVEDYTNLFYRLTCKGHYDTTCHANTYYTLYKHKREFLDWQTAPKKVYIQEDKDMYEDVLEMSLVMVALLCTFVVFVAQMVRTRNPDKDYKRLIAVSPTIIALADGLMISVICRKAIYNYYLSQMRGLDEITDHTYVGFPYSLAMYGVALLANVMGAYLNTSQMAGILKKPLQRKRSVDFDVMVPAATKVPMTETTGVNETPVSKIGGSSYDNPSFSVKL